MKLKRDIGSSRLAAVAALYFALALNLAFWRFVWTHAEVTDAGSVAFLASMPIVLFLLMYIVFNLILWPYLGKTVLVVLLITAAAANYFMFTLNVHIDSDMIRNVFESKPHEAVEMVTTSGILWVLLLGILPAVLLLRLHIVYRRPLREAGVRALHILIALAIMGGIGLSFYKEYSSTARNNKTVYKLISPINYIASTRSYFRKIKRKNRPFVVIDEDPDHVPYEDPYFTVLVVMVGETARAMNFSLNGYERETNPKLSRQDIVNFPNVTASGTATAFSLPCMFSHLPREKFDIDSSYRSENLLDVMQKAGYDVV